jgi:hypothetical protein
MRHKDLCAGIMIVAVEAKLGAELDRCAKREKKLLYAWMEQHWDALLPILEHTMVITEMEPEAQTPAPVNEHSPISAGEK